MEATNTSYGSVRHLADGAAYLFAEHTVRPGQAIPVRSHPRDHRSFVVLEGQVELEVPRGDGEIETKAYGYLSGWHAFPQSAYRIASIGSEPAVLLEAGSVLGETTQACALPGHDAAACVDLSDYTVNKPWGSEIWYTRNIPDVPYALKRIQMTTGHRSSLQSHRHKMETNYVIEGVATVLSGVMAPEDLSAVIDVGQLTTTVHRPRSGWTSPPGELHRVIAQTDYTSIEVSTPELDDVIRWQDDTDRRHGRIDSEHAKART
jgi:mannose-6-phosphate isomerase-like protein (cupin superfamily)